MTDFLNTNDPCPQRLDFEAALKKTQELIKDHLRNAPLVIRPYTRHLAKSTGKMIRARALLICALGGGNLIDESAAKAAAAIELVHLASLVHDDIIDEAPMRRGISTLNKDFGAKTAVLCGDYLLSLAMKLASGMENLKERSVQKGDLLPGYLTQVCLGELLQNQNLYNFDLSEREYFKIITGKTAALFEASFLLGHLFSEENQDLGDSYVALGKKLGVIFQLADDCADYETTEKTSKKPVLNDYSKGVITLPLIYAMKIDPSLREKAQAGISPEEIKAGVSAAGGLTYTHGKISRSFKQSVKIIGQMDISEDKKDRLLTLFEKASGLVKA